MALLVLAVVKPPRGFASAGAHLHLDLPSLRPAFDRVLHSPMLGPSTEVPHNSVLVQEFAAGTVYVVDVPRRASEGGGAVVVRRARGQRGAVRVPRDEAGVRGQGGVAEGTVSPRDGLA